MKLLALVVCHFLLIISAQDLQFLDETGDGDVKDQCAMLNQVQSVVIQLLSGHFEFNKGLEVLTTAADSLQHDVNTLKGLYTEVNVTHRDLLQLFGSLVGVEGELSDNLTMPNTSQALQTLRQNLQLDIKATSDRSTNENTDNPGYILELSKKIDNLAKKFSQTEKQNKRLLRKYSAVNSAVARVESLGRNLSAESSSVQHFLSNQKEINGKLLNKIRYLEQNMERMTQNDSPYLQPSGCPQHFVRNFMSCYYFVNETLNWIDAEKMCQSYDAHSHLIGLETAEEEQFIVKFRNYNQAHWSSMYIWTGGNDMGRESSWNWVSTGKPMTYRNWRPNQPDNHNNEWQNCVYLRTDGLDHRWDDWHCHAAKLNYVCEIQLSA